MTTPPKDLNYEQPQADISQSDYDEFLYAVSHDLRAPIRHINSYAKIIAEHKAHNFDEETAEYFARLVSASDQLSGMFSGLLQLSRLNTRQNPLALVKLDEIISSVVRSDLKEKLDASNAVLQVADLPQVVGDADQLAMLFYELIDNAVKFVDEGTTPDIQITVSQSDAFWDFSIADNGIGLDKKYHKAMFDIFKTIHKSKDYPGDRVGLTAVRKIITRHHGKIHIKENAIKGLTVHFSISKDLTVEEDAD